MDANQRLFEQEAPLESQEQNHKWKSFSTPTGISTDDSDCFACNICLDSAHDPVITLCGHLFCWPCIYKWLHIKSSSPNDQQQPNCPVCKANLSLNSLVPLYGRGISRSDSMPKKDMIVPQRPSPTLTTITSQMQPHPFHRHRTIHDSYRGYGTLASSQNLSPMFGMFGELIFARVFGSPYTNMFAYSYPDSNSLMGSYSQPRMRRQEVQLDKSLNRVSFFLFCCIILCLLLF